jgi:hypothetical protein
MNNGTELDVLPAGTLFRTNHASIADRAISPTVFEVRLLDTSAF